MHAAHVICAGDVASDAPLFMLSPDVREFYTRMLDLRRERPLPRFADLDLMAMYWLAPYVMLIDVDQTTCRNQLRFVGTGVVAALGQETTGMFIDQIDIGPYRSQQLSAFNQAVASKKIQWTFVSAAASKSGMSDGKRSIIYERLIVPCTDDQDNIKQLAAILHCSETPKQSPGFDHREIIIAPAESLG